MNKQIELLPLVKIQWDELCNEKNRHLLSHVTMDIDNQPVFCRIDGHLYFAGFMNDVKNQLGL